MFEWLKNSKKKFTDLSIKEQNQSNTVFFHTDKENGVVVCRLYDRWYDRFHVAKTRCVGGDKFNEKKGRAIAFNKARKKELEFNLRMIEDERNALDSFYREETERLSKRHHINVIYLEGVKEELKDLFGITDENVNDVVEDAEAVVETPTQEVTSGAGQEDNGENA